MTDIVKTLSPAEITAAIADASKISANTVNVASPKTFIFKGIIGVRFQLISQ